MLAIASQQLNSTFERIVKDKNGVLVRVRFMIVSMHGVLTPHVISVTPLVSQAAPEAVICLPKVSVESPKVIAYIPDFAPIVSPFNEFFFFNSQPTRAPSF